MQVRVVRFPAVFTLLLVLPLAAQRNKTKLPERYDRWLNQEAVYIITDEEKKQFLKVSDNEARDKFIEEFWEVRNPAHGSGRNAFKEEHYARLEYANSHFGRQSQTPGWMTDQGRTYIVFGKPVSMASFKNNGQVYPIDIWYYSNNGGNPSFPAFYWVMFYIPDGIGEYRFYRPYLDGPLKLVRGTQFNTNKDVYDYLKRLGGDVARASLSLDPTEPLNTTDYTPDMSSDILLNRIRNYNGDSFYVRRIREMRALHAKVESWFLTSADKPLEVSVLPLVDPGGESWLDYAVSIDAEKLGTPDPAGKQFVLDVGFRLLTEKGNLIVEDAEQRSYPAYDDTSEGKKFRPFVLANRIPMVPGRYKLEVQISNRKEGKSYKGEKVFAIGDSSRLNLQGPLVAELIQPVAHPDPRTPFQFFGVQFYPAVDRQFSLVNPLRLLYQIQLPPGDLRNYQVEYILVNGYERALRANWNDSVPASEFKDGRLLKSKTITISNLQAGDYRIVMNIRAEGSAEVLASATMPLKIGEAGFMPALYFTGNAQTTGNRGIAAYIRGLEALGQRDDAAAAEFLRQSLEALPSNAFAARTLVQLYFDTKKFDKVTQLYSQLGASAFSGAPETLTQAVLSFWRTGNIAGARKVLESGQTLFPKDPLLAAAAKQISQRP